MSYARSQHHTQLARMSSDDILDLTAVFISYKYACVLCCCCFCVQVYVRGGSGGSGAASFRVMAKKQRGQANGGSGGRGGDVTLVSQPSSLDSPLVACFNGPVACVLLQPEVYGAAYKRQPGSTRRLRSIRRWMGHYLSTWVSISLQFVNLLLCPYTDGSCNCLL